MKTPVQFVTHIFPALALAAALAPALHAGCGDTSQLQAPFAFARGSVNAPLLRQRAAEATRSAAAQSADSNSAPLNGASIVGMWNIQFISLGNTAHNPSIPDGALLDFGYVQWHSDGTELMNSGGHAANTGNFCMGTWVRTGFLTYELNHFALSYDATTGALVAKIDIREQVTLDPGGNEFTGTLTIDAYDPASGAKVDSVAGTISATRVTIDQTVP